MGETLDILMMYIFSISSTKMSQYQVMCLEGYACFYFALHISTIG